MTLQAIITAIMAAKDDPWTPVREAFILAAIRAWYTLDALTAGVR